LFTGSRFIGLLLAGVNIGTKFCIDTFKKIIKTFFADALPTKIEKILFCHSSRF